MKTCTEIRRENAQALAKEGPAEFARRVGMTGQQANQIIGPNPTRGIGDNMARKIEEAYGRDVGWLDNLHSSDSPNVAISGQNAPLSDEARALILCVTCLDGLGEVAHKTFEFHTGLLQLSAAFTEFQTASARSQMLAEADRLLSSRLDNSGGTHERRNK
jgi:hypothetical protein